MKFVIETAELKKGLNVVNHATAGVTSAPILENILIEVTKEKIKLTANNLELAIEYEILEGFSVEEEGKFCIPSKLFSSYIGLLSDLKINISLESNDNLLLKSESSKTKIKGMKAEDFPVIPVIYESESFKINSSILKKSIEKTIFSTAEGNIRPTLAGIFMKISGSTAIFASTDSFRLSEIQIESKETFEKSFENIIPSKTAFNLKSMLPENSEVEVFYSGNQAGFFFGNVKVYSRLLAGKFPDYSAFFPKSYETKAEINRLDLIFALKRTNLISIQNNYFVKIKFSVEDGLVINTGESQVGEGEVKVITSVEGEEAEIGVKSIYLLEVLNVIETDYVQLSFKDALSPISVIPFEEDGVDEKDGKFRHILMPLKI